MFDFVRNESLIQAGADTQVTGLPNLPGMFDYFWFARDPRG
jgi:hypothetical protein